MHTVWCMSTVQVLIIILHELKQYSFGSGDFRLAWNKANSPVKALATKRHRLRTIQSDLVYS